MAGNTIVFTLCVSERKRVPISPKTYGLYAITHFIISNRACFGEKVTAACMTLSVRTVIFIVNKFMLKLENVILNFRIGHGRCSA